MIKKYSILLGIIISVSLLLIATSYYPGGSQFDKTAIGWHWKKNYISNLFSEKAINGLNNTSRVWAITGMFFLAASFALFFIQFSKRIPVKSAANIIKYVGAIGMLFTFLIATPLHDIMVTVSATLFLVAIFYITVFVFKTKLHSLKLLCTICLLVFYCTLFLYGFGSWTFLPIMQKVTFIIAALTVLGLEYFTKKEDFQHIKSGKQNSSEE